MIEMIKERGYPPFYPALPSFIKVPLWRETLALTPYIFDKP